MGSNTQSQKPIKPNTASRQPCAWSYAYDVLTSHHKRSCTAIDAAAMVAREMNPVTRTAALGLELEFQSELYAPRSILLRRHDAKDGA